MAVWLDRGSMAVRAASLCSWLPWALAAPLPPSPLSCSECPPVGRRKKAPKFSLAFFFFASNLRFFLFLLLVLELLFQLWKNDTLKMRRCT